MTETLQVFIDADSLCFVKDDDTKDVAISKLKYKIKKIDKAIQNRFLLLNGVEYNFYLTMGKTFRNEIFSDYKANRVKKKNDLVYFLKDYLIEHYGAEYDTKYEADDLVADKKRENPGGVLCSIDKDLLYNIPGEHLNLHNYKFVYTDESEIKHNFFNQMIKGDGVDNIPDILPGIGPVKLKAMVYETGLDLEKISKYVCYKKGIDYGLRYRLLYCGKEVDDENNLINDNEIEEHEYIDYVIENKNISLKQRYHGHNPKPYNKVIFGKYKFKYRWYEVLERDELYIDWIIENFDNEKLVEMLKGMKEIKHKYNLNSL